MKANHLAKPQAALIKIFAEKFPDYIKPIYGMKAEEITKGPDTNDITDTHKEKKVAEKNPVMTDVEIKSGGGSGGTDEVIVKGPGNKGGGGHGNTYSITGTTIENGGVGDDPTKKFVAQSQDPTGKNAYKFRRVAEVDIKVPIVPHPTVRDESHEKDNRLVFVSDNDPECKFVIANTSKVIIQEIWELPEQKRKPRLAPLVSKAIVNFMIRDRPPISIELYEQMLDAMYEVYLSM